jgi:alpha-beta hydrolase superfamily lysophospholipase
MIAARDLFIDGGAGRLAVRVKTPDSPSAAVVLVQGSNLSGQGMFDFCVDPGDGYSLMNALAEGGLTAVTFAIRGYGSSDAPEDPFTVTTETALEDLDTVMAWVVAEGLAARPHLFGFSWGGRIAGRWAEDNAERLNRLVLYDPARGGGNLVLPAPGPDEGWWLNSPTAYSEKMDPRFTDPAFGRALAAYVVANEPRSPNGIRRENARYVIPIQPARITRPTLLIYGVEAAKANYMRGGVERGDFFEQLASDDKAFIVLPGGDDFLHWQAGRSLLCRRVVEFLT